MLKIDAYNHIFPEPFWKRMLEVAGDHADIGKRVRNIPMLIDLDERFRVMDLFDDYLQVLSLASPPLETLGGEAIAGELARIANDGMAELVDLFPERFPGFVASLALCDPDTALAEAQRAVVELGAVGIQIFTNCCGRPMDGPEFAPLFAMMAEADRPLWVHPTRGADSADYLTEEHSKYEIWWTLGWPYETSVFMARMVFSGLFDRHPEIKIITHHLGAMIPYFEGRIGPGWDQLGSRTSGDANDGVLKRLSRRPIDYFHDFYADTAVFGSAAATRCGLEFFGADRVLFASDAPFDPEKGPGYIRATIRILDELEMSEQDRASIYHGNAIHLLKLPVS